MAAAAYRRIDRTMNMPMTRVYAPTAGSMAYAPEEEKEYQEQPETANAEQVQNEEKTAERTFVLPKISTFGKLVVLALLAALTFAVLFVMFRYERISSQYSAVNAIRSEIEQTNIRITELNVQLQCAVNIDEVRDIAESKGMTYPETSQFVKVNE